MVELDYKDLGEIWSDSDASDYREEEAQIDIDNIIMTKFTNAKERNDQSSMA